MNFSVLQFIQCPFCGGSLASRRNSISDEPGYAVLSCHCGSYPVVAGIPILKKGVIGHASLTADRVISLIETGRSREALISLLMPPSPSRTELASSWLHAWPPVRGIRRLISLAERRALRAWRQQAVVFLTQLGAPVTVCDLLDFYFRPSARARRDPYCYYAFCFGQPRYLAALSLASLIQAPDKPILDLACGYGHITRHLLPRAQAQPVIGVDRNFFSLYVAKGWMAPKAAYVCTESDVALPFRDDSFSTVFCSNAFQLFDRKVSCIRELKRLTRETGLILLVSVRNALVKLDLYEHATHRALPPAGYETLVADMPHRLIGNTDIVTHYLNKEGPALARSAEIECLCEQQWLSVVASHRKDIFRDYQGFEDWPHAEGRLALNPLYEQEAAEESGRVRLRLRMPSPWYEQEDGDCRQYEPETVSLDAQVLRDLAQGRRTVEIERLLEQCVVVGLPERFQ